MKWNYHLWAGVCSQFHEVADPFCVSSASGLVIKYSNIAQASPEGYGCSRLVIRIDFAELWLKMNCVEEPGRVHPRYRDEYTSFTY